MIPDAPPRSPEIGAPLRIRAPDCEPRRSGHKAPLPRPRAPAWPRLDRVTVLEYKSPVDSAFRPGDLRCLLGYGVLYETAHLDEVPEREELTLVLVVASITPTLLKEIERNGWTLTLQGGG